MFRALLIEELRPSIPFPGRSVPRIFINYYTCTPWTTLEQFRPMDNRAFLLCELLVILLVVSTTAHFGGKPDIDASAQTSQTLGRLKRALDSCLNSDKSHHLRKRAAKRRAQFFELLRSKGHLSRGK